MRPTKETTKPSKRAKANMNKSQEVNKNLLQKNKLVKTPDDHKKKIVFLQPKNDNVVKNINITSMINEY